MAASADLQLLTYTTELVKAMQENCGTIDTYDFVTGPLEYMKETLFQLWIVLPECNASRDIECMLHVATSARKFVEENLDDPVLLRMSLPVKSHCLVASNAAYRRTRFLTDLRATVKFFQSNHVMQNAGTLVGKCCDHVQEAMVQLYAPRNEL
jgi:hypothetical protein